MAHKAGQVRITVGPQGRVVIPSKMRRSLGISRGDTLVARIEGERIVLEKRAEILTRLKRRFERVPENVSLSDELISERREEARRESEER